MKRVGILVVILLVLGPVLVSCSQPTQEPSVETPAPTETPTPTEEKPEEPTETPKPTPSPPIEVEWKNIGPDREPHRLSGGIDGLLVLNEKVILASEYGNIWRSENGGESWVNVSKVTCETSIVQDPNHPNMLYVGTRFNGIARSDDRGKTWILPKVGWGTRCLAIDAESTIWIVRDEGIFKSGDGAESWEKIYDRTPFYKKQQEAHELRVKAEEIWGPWNWSMPDPKGEGILISNDHGKTWQKVNDELMIRWFEANTEMFELQREFNEAWQKIEAKAIVTATHYCNCSAPGWKNSSQLFAQFPSLQGLSGKATFEYFPSVDPNNNDNQFVAIVLGPPPCGIFTRLFLSLDGGKTYREIATPPSDWTITWRMGPEGKGTCISEHNLKAGATAIISCQGNLKFYLGLAQSGYGEQSGESVVLEATLPIASLLD